MSVDLGQFHHALRDPAADIPDGLIGPTGGQAGRRFNVYRNNVTTSLMEALKQAFPVICKLLGDTNFRNLARDYQALYPPRSPLMMFYGEDFPAYLAQFSPLAKYPYLCDVARLEFARRQSYHAADAAPLDWSAVAELSEDQLLDSIFHLAPSVRIMSSAWPAFSIWRYNTQTRAPKPTAKPETILIARPEFDPVVEEIAPADAALIGAFANGQPLSVALHAAQAVDQNHDFGRILGRLLALNALTRRTQKDG